MVSLCRIESKALLFNSSPSNCIVIEPNRFVFFLRILSQVGRPRSCQPEFSITLIHFANNTKPTLFAPWIINSMLSCLLFSNLRVKEPKRIYFFLYIKSYMQSPRLEVIESSKTIPYFAKHGQIFLVVSWIAEFVLSFSRYFTFEI